MDIKEKWVYHACRVESGMDERWIGLVGGLDWCEDIWIQWRGKLW